MCCSLNPTALRLSAGICLTIIVISLMVVLDVASMEKVGDEYVCTKDSMDEESVNRSCWDWSMNFNEPDCPFKLMFVATIIFGVALVILVITAIFRRHYPGFERCIQRRLCFRWISHYFQLFLGMLASAILLAFIVNVLTHTIKGPCFKVADMLNNCEQGRKFCWMFGLTCTSFVLGLLASLFSGWEVARFYRSLNDEEKERIYQRYIDYSSSEDLNVVN